MYRLWKLSVWQLYVMIRVSAPWYTFSLKFLRGYGIFGRGYLSSTIRLGFKLSPHHCKRSLWMTPKKLLKLSHTLFVNWIHFFSDQNPLWLLGHKHTINFPVFAGFFNENFYNSVQKFRKQKSEVRLALSNNLKKF